MCTVHLFRYSILHCCYLFLHVTDILHLRLYDAIVVVHCDFTMGTRSGGRPSRPRVLSEFCWSLLCRVTARWKVPTLRYCRTVSVRFLHFAAATRHLFYSFLPLPLRAVAFILCLPAVFVVVCIPIYYHPARACRPAYITLPPYRYTGPAPHYQIFIPRYHSTWLTYSLPFTRLIFCCRCFIHDWCVFVAFSSFSSGAANTVFAGGFVLPSCTVSTLIH